MQKLLTTSQFSLLPTCREDYSSQPHPGSQAAPRHLEKRRQVALLIWAPVHPSVCLGLCVTPWMSVAAVTSVSMQHEWETWGVLSHWDFEVSYHTSLFQGPSPQVRFSVDIQWKNRVLLCGQRTNLWDRMSHVCINKRFLFIKEKLAMILVHIPSVLILCFRVTWLCFLTKSWKTPQGFFSHMSFLIMLPYINTIFICNKIRDYLSIFRCSSSSEPGQGCLYTFGLTSRLSCWPLLRICQEWHFISDSSTSCRWQQV